MAETVITEDFFKELHDDYVSIKSYLKKAKTEQTEEESDESHKKAKATADKMLQAAENAMKTIDVDNKYYYRLLGIRSSIKCEQSKLLTMSKLPEDAEGVLSSALEYLLDGALKPEISFIVLRIINHFSYVLSVCERYDEARVMLEQGEKIYDMLKADLGPDQTLSFYTGDDLFVAGLEMTARPETNEQVEHLVTNSLQMLGHMYNKQGRDDKFAEYQHRALQRQLAMQEGDAMAWSVKASRLASYFVSKGMFREARTHLAAASQVLDSYEMDVKSNEKDENLADKLAEVNMRLANLGRSWVKYALKLVAASKQSMISEFCGDPVNSAEDMNVETDGDEDLTVDTDDQEETELVPARDEYDEVLPVADETSREDGDKAEVKEEGDKENGEVVKEKGDGGAAVKKGDGEEVVNESGEGVNESGEGVKEKKEGEGEKEEVDGSCGEGIPPVKEVIEDNVVEVVSLEADNVEADKVEADNVEAAKTEEVASSEDVTEDGSVALGEGISKIDIINNKVTTGETNNEEDDLPRMPSGNNIPIPLTATAFTFPTMNLSGYESVVPCDLIVAPEVARKFFGFLHNWQKIVIAHYNVREYPAEYLAAAMDIIDVIRMMAFFETDIDMMYSVHKARYDGLEALCEVLNKVHPAEFLHASVDLFRELADVQLEMMGLNLRRLFMVTSEKKLDEEDEEEEKEEGVEVGVDTRDLDKTSVKGEDNAAFQAGDEEEGEEEEEDEEEEVEDEVTEDETIPQKESEIILLNKSPAVEDLVAKLDEV